MRARDIFGAPVGLKLAGESSYKTLGGGLVSVSLKVLIFAYFCKQMIAVFNYVDPLISSYSIYESREWMEEEVSFADFGASLYFFFVDPTGIPIPLEPEIGSLRLHKVQNVYDSNFGLDRRVIEVGTREVDFLVENNPSIYFDNLPVKGVYAPEDFSLFRLKGTTL